MVEVDIKKMYEEAKIDPEIYRIDMEDRERVLRKAGVTDLIELMKCRNCLYYKDGICVDSGDKVDSEHHCPIFTENLGKGKKINDIYKGLVDILRSYIDMKEDNYKIVALWIIGTYLHHQFPTYPYLFINAMKGSGKTRLLKLIKYLAKDGDMLASLSEAVLFRTTGTLCIDEFEGVSSKDKNALRELLNTAYKKGGKVKRMKKVHTKEGEEQKVEEFATYRPIVMANISGMEEVLQDRCIPIILERSNNLHLTRKIEVYEEDALISQILGELGKFSVGICSVCCEKNIYREWNEYIDIHTPKYILTITTPPSISIHNDFFKQVYDTNINGRNLELTFPLLLIAYEAGILEDTIRIVNNVVKDKKESDYLEGRDVMLIDFITKQAEREYYTIQTLTSQFKHFINYEPDEESRNWLNNAWLGKALTRLNLIAKKRRISAGIEVMLNVEKAIEKMAIFK